MTTTGSETSDLDVVAANIGDVRDPYAGYERARRETPVARMNHLGADVAMVYRFAEAEEVLGDSETFSSAINGKWMRPFLGRTLLEMDGADHRTHRRLISHAFRRKVVQDWEENLIRPTAHELIDRFASRSRAELVREFAWEFPVRIIAKMVGVPRVDYAMWQQKAIELERTGVDFRGAVAASNELKAYFGPMVEERRREPRDDVISMLAEAEMEGERLDDELIHSFLRLLVPAGAGTTYRLIGSLMLGLVGAPEQLEAVRADRSLVAAAVEESLRWEAPVQFAAREATRDVELGGVAVEAGTPVTVALGSANHDDSRWVEPERFDVRRKAQGHLAFADGEHFCLGAHLARLEGAVALEAILDRLEDLRLDTEGAEPYVVGFAFRSPTSVPVTFRGG
ncbi:MAG: cytochrome P450 [Actinomycetota bacterium]